MQLWSMIFDETKYTFDMIYDVRAGTEIIEAVLFLQIGEIEEKLTLEVLSLISNKTTLAQVSYKLKR